MKKRGRPARARPRGGAGAVRDKVFALGAQCTIREAPALKARLTKLLGHKGAIALDASRVERIDTACLQLLTAFVRTRHAQSRVIAWRSATAAFTDSVRLLGLAGLLGTEAPQLEAGHA
jgi:anti-anti-sigma regulatory factor